MSHFQRVGMALELPNDPKEGQGGRWRGLEVSVLEFWEELIPLFPPEAGRNRSQAPPNRSWVSYCFIFFLGIMQSEGKQTEQ